MKRLAVAIILGIVVGSTTGCGKEEDFLSASWGSTVEEVVSIQKVAGNLNYTQITPPGKESIEVHYKDLKVEDWSVDAQYVFAKVADKTEILDFEDYNPAFKEVSELLSEEGMTPEKEKEILDKFNKKHKKKLATYQEIPQTINFKQDILLNGYFYFLNMNPGDSDKLLDHLTSIYGTPKEQEGNYTWSTERSKVYYNGNAFVSYLATFHSVKEHIKKDS